MTALVSVIVPVKNEETNIEACLQSIAWADEIFVVDSQSTDQTIAIAERMGANVVQFHYDGTWPKKKNWALENLSFCNEWILIVDADERIPRELADEIQKVLQNPEYDGYYINRRFLFLGRWIKHCGWYPSWNLRLFKHRLGRYEFLGEGTEDSRTGDNEVHEHVLLQGQAGYLKNDMLHEDYKDLFHWIERHNRYSSWEAHAYQHLISDETGGSLQASLFGGPVERRRLLRKLWIRMPYKSALIFLRMYIFQLGFLDGKAGYYFCRLHSHNQFNIRAKQYELGLWKL